MALSVVQSKAGTVSVVGNTVTITGLTTTTGNLLMVAVGIRSATVAVNASGVSDTVNTWGSSAVFRKSSSSTAALEVWTTTGASPTGLSGGTITVTLSAATVISVARMWEISGANNAASVDVSASAGSAATGTAAASTATATLGATNELALGATVNDYGATARTFSAGTFTQGAPSTSYPTATTGDLSIDGASHGIEIHSGVLIITTTTGQAFSDTISAASNWAAGVWVVKAAAAVASPAPPLRVVNQAVNRAGTF